MTVSKLITGTMAIGNGATTVFEFPFTADEGSSIKVAYIESNGLLVPMPESDYSVTLSVTSEAGEVTITVDGQPLAAGTKIYIYRDTIIDQLIDLTNQVRYNPAVTENAWDKLTLIAQEIKRMAGSSIRGVSEVAAFVPEPGHVPVLSDDGLSWVNGPNVTEIYAATLAAQEAQDAAERAELAASAAESASDAVTRLAPSVNRFNADGTYNSFTIPGVYDSTKYILLWIGGEAQPRDRFTVAPDYSGNQTMITWLGRTWAAGEMIPKGWLVEWQAQYQVAVQIGEQQWSFAERSGFRTAVEGGFEVAEGTVVFAGGVSYRAEADSIAIPDLPGWVPGGDVTIEHFSGAWAVDAAVGLRAARDYLASIGGGTIRLMGKTYPLQSTETAMTYGVVSDGTGSIAATIACMFLPQKVSLAGVRGQTVLRRSGGEIAAILGLLDYNDGHICDLEIYGVGTDGNVQHGICTYTSSAFRQFDNIHLSGLYVHNVGSYGIGFQAGWQTNCSIKDCRVEDTGADGIDWKVRGISHDQVMNSTWGNQIRNVIVRNPAQRDAVMSDSSGIGIRGQMIASDIHVYGVRAGAGAGIDFDPGISNGEDFREPAHKSSLTNFYVDAADPAAGGMGVRAWVSGNIVISNGVCVGCRVTSPAATATPFVPLDGDSISNVTVVGARGTNAFETFAPRVHYNGCRAVSEKQYFSTKRTNLAVGQTAIAVKHGTGTAAGGIPLVVLRNGTTLTLTTDYTVSATGITLIAPAVDGDEIVVIFPANRGIRIEANYCSVIGGGADKWTGAGVSYSSNDATYSGVAWGFLWEDRPIVTQVTLTDVAVAQAVKAGSTAGIQLQGSGMAPAIINRPRFSNAPTTADSAALGTVWSDAGDLKIV